MTPSNNEHGMKIVGWLNDDGIAVADEFKWQDMEYYAGYTIPLVRLSDAMRGREELVEGLRKAIRWGEDLYGRIPPNEHVNFRDLNLARGVLDKYSAAPETKKEQE